MPIFFRITASGQNPVNDACNKFAPTNPVKNNQFKLWLTAIMMLNSIIVPAKLITALSMVMGTSSNY